MKKVEYSACLTARHMLRGMCLFLIGSALAGTCQASGMDDAKKMPSGIKRDPFWPVGYVPDFVVPAAGIDEKAIPVKSDGNSWDAAMKKVVINGVSNRANNQFCAVINGRLMEVGDTISVSHEGVIYTWAVDSIAVPGSVKLRRVSSIAKR